MKILIAEDDSNSASFLREFLSQYGECGIAADGMKAVEAYINSRKIRSPYDLICLDIMMPKIDGVNVLRIIREFETKNGILPEKRVKVILTTALGEAKLVHTAFKYDCEAYISKPIDTQRFVETMKKIGLLDK